MAKVAVLGCGPAGLLAAHATELAGHTPIILSRRVKSAIGGAQFLHESIPGLHGKGPHAQIMFKKHGNREGYAQKVYGDKGAPCSWEEFAEGEMPMWSLHHTYNALWDRFESRIQNCTVDKALINSLAGTYERTPGSHPHEMPQNENDLKRLFKNSYDLIISTIPAFTLCQKPKKHKFDAAEIWIRPFSVMLSHDDDPCVLYNGDATTAWYRTSLIFGHGSTEFSHRVRDAVVGKKPLDTNCDCFAHILRVGRFGKWQKGILLHHAFKESLNALQQLS